MSIEYTCINNITEELLKWKEQQILNARVITEDIIIERQDRLDFYTANFLQV